MKKILSSLILIGTLFLSIIPFVNGASPWYVSNLAVNGYALGNDSNNCTSPSTPCLTIAGALSLSSSAGGIIYLNPTSNSLTSANHPYVETTQVNTNGKAVTIEGDPAYVNYTTPTLAVIQSTGTNQVVNTTGETTVTFQDVVIDAQNVATKHAFATHNQPSITFTRVIPVNCNSSTIFTGFTGASNEVFNDVTMDPSCVYTSAWMSAVGQSSGTLDIKGGTYTQVGITNIPTFTFSGGTITTLTIEADTNGISPAISGDGQFMRMGTAGTVNITAANCNNPFSLLQFASSTGAVTSALNMSGVIYTTGSNDSGGGGVIANPNEQIVWGSIHDNILNGTTNNSSTSIPLNMGNGTGSPQVYNNTITYQGASHAFQLGQDGFNVDQSNTATTTGGQKIGDVSNDTYVDQFVTTSASTAASHSSYIAEAIVTLKTVGSPVGNITAKMYADNAGVPGTLLDTSTTTLAMSSLTSSYLQYAFEFNGIKVNPSTKVHFVFQSSTTDASNYILMSENTTTTIGSILTAPDNTTWTANTGNALLFFLNTGTYGFIDSHVSYMNVQSSFANMSSITHMIAMASQIRGKVDHCIVIGGSLGVMFKENKGGTANNPALGFDNLIYQPYGGIAGVGPLLVKASSYVDFYNNVAILGTTSLGAVANITNDSNTNYSPVNSLQSDHPTLENNILIQLGSSGTQTIYNQRQNGLGIAPTNVVINNNIDWNPAGSSIGIIQNSSSTTITTYANMAAWQGVGYDINGINQDPLLKNETNPSISSDFIPGATSPAKRAGVSTGGLVTTDYLGNQYAPIPDIGAYSLQYSGYAIPAYQYNNAVISATNYIPPLLNTSFPINIGIGSANPSQALDVAGTIRTTNFTMTGQSPASGYVLTSKDTSGNAIWSSSTSVSNWTKIGNDIYNNNSGNVGIGTSTAGYNLTVHASAANNNMIELQNNSGTKLWDFSSSGSPYGDGFMQGYSAGTQRIAINTNSPYYHVNDSAGHAEASLQLGGSDPDTGGLLSLSSNQATKIQLNGEGNSFFNSGNVSIGTSASANLLDVAGNVGIGTNGSTNQILLPFGTVGAPAYSFNGQKTSGIYSDGTGSVSVSNIGTNSWTFTASGNLISNNGGLISLGNGSASTPGIRFFNASSTGIYDPGAGAMGVSINGVDAIRLDTNRNVGIGTTTPQGSLVVTNGNVGIGTWVPTSALNIIGNPGNIINVQSSSVNSVSSILFNDILQGENAQFGYDGNNNYTFIKTDTFTNGATRLVILRDSGNVGIGSTAPGQLLDVQGTVRISKLGSTISIVTGTNACKGQATLSAGTVTVSTTCAPATSEGIFLADATTGVLTNVGTPTVGTITSGTSFVINSSNVLDSSNINWVILKSN